MGKSIRSKVKKRWRSLKRQHLDNVKGLTDLQHMNDKLQASIQNRPYRIPEPKNAFLYPNDPEAQFPQYKPPVLIDFRSSAIPQAGSQYVGAHRLKQKKNIERTIVVSDEGIQLDEEVEEVEEPEEDLAAAMSNLGVKTRSEKKKLGKQMRMADEITKKKIGKKQKGGKVQGKKSKKILKF